MTDADDIWNLNNGHHPPSQAAGVDAHYYANVVDDFYGDVFGRNSIDDNGMQIISIVHYDTNYCNAFWNGAYMTYGDGDGTHLPAAVRRPGRGRPRADPRRHGVHLEPDLRERVRRAQRGVQRHDGQHDRVLRRSAASSTRAGTPDWLIGEDVINDAGPATAGFRNMGDPQEFGDPSDHSQKYTGTADNGGVHTNSGIANHAYYLAVNGGKNAGCTANATTACR